MPVSHRQESLIRSLYTRHGRKKTGCCVCEGLRCCTEVFAALPAQVEFTLATPEMQQQIAIPGETVLCSAAEIDRLGATVNGQGILSVVKRPPDAVGKVDVPFVLVLDQVGDPGNFGTIIRTARAAGLPEVWYTTGSADPYNDKVIRSALGAQFSMRLRELPNLAEVRNLAGQYGFNELFITDPHQGENCYLTDDLFAKSLVVIGSEGNGVPENEPGRRVMIPMPGEFESLNAAQAATIFIFEYVRRSFSPQNL